jgi:uncharacterized protein YbaR (Trm112 family)
MEKQILEYREEEAYNYPEEDGDSQQLGYCPNCRNIYPIDEGTICPDCRNAILEEQEEE